MAKGGGVLSFKQNDNNNAIAYYRYSSHSQNEASIDQQRELAHKWAEDHGFKLIREYEDAAISGTTEDGPGFQRMLSEVATLKPAVLILWKTDRLGRDKYVLAYARHVIAKAGCSIRYVAESVPDDPATASFIESLYDGWAQYYSMQLSANIKRGMHYNAEHGLYNGHKLLGYDVDRETKKYILDPKTAPIVKKAFVDYADGKSMQAIADEMNEAGVRSVRGCKITVKSLNRTFKNRRYIGEYNDSGFVHKDAIPAIVDYDLFDKVQRRMLVNKRLGAKTKEQLEDYDGPRYWLTGKLFCEVCGGPMCGVSGTSKTGAKYYYYSCKNRRAKKCDKCIERKDWLECVVEQMLDKLMHNTENVASMAVDFASNWNDVYGDGKYLESLKQKRVEVSKSLDNIVKAIENGAFNDRLKARMEELEEQEKSLKDIIAIEEPKVDLERHKHTIASYFEKFVNACLHEAEVRDAVMEYFVKAIYVSDTSVQMEFLYDDMIPDEFPFDAFKEASRSDFRVGETARIEFDCFPVCSTDIEAWK